MLTQGEHTGPIMISLVIVSTIPHNCCHNHHPHHRSWRKARRRKSRDGGSRHLQHLRILRPGNAHHWLLLQVNMVISFGLVLFGLLLLVFCCLLFYLVFYGFVQWYIFFQQKHILFFGKRPNQLCKEKFS